jgi:hypothetical protein
MLPLALLPASAAMSVDGVLLDDAGVTLLLRTTSAACRRSTSTAATRAPSATCRRRAG